MTRDIFIWWLTVQVFGLAGLPLTRFVFRALPDRGYAFGKSLGLLLSGYLAWLLAMLGLAPFGRGLLVICALAVGAIGLFITREPRTKNRRTGEPESGEPKTDNQEPQNQEAGLLNAGKRGEARGIEDKETRRQGDKENQEPENLRTGEPKNQEPQSRRTAEPQTPDTRHPTLDTRHPTISNLQFAIPKNWRLLLCYEVLFALALIFLALLRSYNPDPWGTERPMDYALFNAIRGSSAFPPHDPWMAGFSINYYYFGYLLMAAMSLVSGIDQGVAYNLALALIFALTALGVAGLVVNLIELTGRQGDQETRRQGEEPSRFLLVSLSRGSVGRVAAVLLAVVLVLFAGNQGGALEVVTGLASPLAMDARDLARAVQNGLGPREPLYLLHPYKEWGAPDVTSVLTPADMVANFNWWNPSRALWDTSRDPGDPTKFYAITEFPFFSFWLGDMHPHVMALPFGLLALALALQTVARPAAPTYAAGRRGWAELALTGIVLGSLYTINSWDFPTYVLVFLGALLLLYVRLGTRGWGMGDGDWEHGPFPTPIPQPPSPITGIWWQHLATQAIMALLAAWLLFVPFYLTFRSLVGSKEPLIALPILSALTRTIGIVTWTKTPLHSFLIIFGLMLAPLVAYLIAQSRLVVQLPELLPVPTEDSDPPAEPVAASWHEDQRLGFAARLATPVSWRYLPLALLAVLLVGVALGFPLLVLLALAIYAARLALARAGKPAEAFVLMAFALVCLICFGTELVYIRDVFELRMNTIFKFYYQAWLIWGVLAGYAVWWLVAGRRTKDEGRRTIAERKISSIVGRLSSVVVGVLFLALLAGALVYPWLTAGKSFREEQRVGLAGKTPAEHTPDGAAAIDWLRTNVPSNAVVLEASGDDYDGRGIGANAVSASTGLATVLGWAGHEQQWRGGDPLTYAQIDPRKADIATIYNAGDLGQARELLAKYKVDYIYAGTAEQATYAQIDPNKLAQLGEQVFQQGNVTIYRVTSFPTRHLLLVTRHLAYR